MADEYVDVTVQELCDKHHWSRDLTPFL